jgi:hypothetical protein
MVIDARIGAAEVECAAIPPVDVAGTDRQQYQPGLSRDRDGERALGLEAPE